MRHCRISLEQSRNIRVATNPTATVSKTLPKLCCRVRLRVSCRIGDAHGERQRYPDHPLRPDVGLSGLEPPSSDSNQDALYQGTTSSRAVRPGKNVRASAPEEIHSAGAPLEPDVGLSGLNTPSADNPAKAGSDEPHPTTLDLQACAAPGCPTLLRLQSADRVGSLTVSPLTAFSTGRFLADRFSANPKRLPCQHIRRDRGDLFRRRKSGCRTLACPQSADRVGSLTASQLTAFQLAGS